jgi:hypothetical protein
MRLRLLPIVLFALALAESAGRVFAAAPEATASWFGFDKEDATTAIQAAINSGAKKVVVDNTGSDWIVNRPVNLAGNQEVVFEDGVVVRAMKGRFKGIGDPLFRARDVSNLTFRGIGTARLVMNKEEYEKLSGRAGIMGARHVLSISGCKNVTVENLSFEKAGGDGIYITGGSQDVLIDNVVCDGNYRLGLAVISAENLTVRNSRFRNALGGSPQGGIDLEPNNNREKLINILVEKCVFENNVKGAGISVSPNHLDATSPPVSITVRDCLFRGNSLAFFLYPTRGMASDPRGNVLVEDCRMENTVLFSNPVDGTVKIKFKNCTGISKKNGPFFNVRITDCAGKKGGGIEFENITVSETKPASAPISVSLEGAGGLANSIAGTIQVERDGKKTAFDLAAFMAERVKYFDFANSLVPAELDKAALQAPADFAVRNGNAGLYTRGCCFLQYAEKGKTITFTTRVLRSGYKAGAEIRIVDPDGEVEAEYQVPSTVGKAEPSDYRFTPAKTGVYTLKCGSINCFDITSDASGSALATAPGFARFLMPAGTFYFGVPKGVREFSVGIAGNVDYELIDASGKSVQKGRCDGSLVFLNGKRADASALETWAVRLARPEWLVAIRMYRPLAPLVSTNPASLFK